MTTCFWAYLPVMLLSLFIPLWSLQWTNAASNNHDPKRFKMLLTFGLRGAGSGLGSELVWFGLDRGEVEDAWCWTFELWTVVTYQKNTSKCPQSWKVGESWGLVKVMLHIKTMMKVLTAVVFMVALFTVTARCLRLCGGVVFTAVLWGILNLFTGVGGALSDLGREMPFGKKKRVLFLRKMELPPKIHISFLLSNRALFQLDREARTNDHTFKLPLQQGVAMFKFREVGDYWIVSQKILQKTSRFPCPSWLLE